ncbi:2-vinyl bacteriochlorophyllide hydratase [Planktomarina sp.]|nr:2-vinyl bacteriochlorophyllide hydratase [Planktomarina sp.]
MTMTASQNLQSSGLYTQDQRSRRDRTVWTTVQGILAPLQFLVFLVSLVLVIRYMVTGLGYEIMTLSIIAKTLLLYLIMITGAIWEKVVFGQWLFAPTFFWEDVVSFGVIALHSLYLYGLIQGTIPADTLVLIILAAYATYVVNAGQFLWKLRAARLQMEAAS